MEHKSQNDKRDEYYMAEALRCAQAAGEAGNVPVGAVWVQSGSILFRAGNARRSSADPTAHAEILALRGASQIVQDWRISGTLIVTQEPCPMCAGALVNARVSRLVYGCPNPKAGAVDTLFDIVRDPRLNHRMEVTKGVLRDECAALLQAFFAKIRQSGRGVREVEGA